MPVTDYTHDEGEYWIIEVPNRSFTRRVLNVPFYEGVARTKYQRKAQQFDETFGYTVTPYTGAPGWTNKPDPALPQSTPEEWEDEDFIPMDVEEEEDFGVEGQFSKPVSTARAVKRGLTRPVRDGGVEDEDGEDSSEEE